MTMKEFAGYADGMSRMSTDPEMIRIYSQLACAFRDSEAEYIARGVEKMKRGKYGKSILVHGN